MKSYTLDIVDIIVDMNYGVSHYNTCNTASLRKENNADAKL